MLTFHHYDNIDWISAIIPIFHSLSKGNNGILFNRFRLALRQVCLVPSPNLSIKIWNKYPDKKIQTAKKDTPKLFTISYIPIPPCILVLDFFPVVLSSNWSSFLFSFGLILFPKLNFTPTLYIRNWALWDWFHTVFW